MKALYNKDDKMVRLVADNYRLIQVMSRFGIRVGFRDKSVREVCRDHNVDCDTFLAVVNFVSENYPANPTTDGISPADLLIYLKQSHIYFLNYFLPAIRRKLLEGMELRTNDISFLILKFFDDYTFEVKKHMESEEETVFAYVTDLLEGILPDDSTVTTYSNHHEEVSGKLNELKRIILQYCPDSGDANKLNDALYDIYRCEEELEGHCHVEDSLLVPTIINLENQIRNKSLK